MMGQDESVLENTVSPGVSGSPVSGLLINGKKSSACSCMKRAVQFRNQLMVTLSPGASAESRRSRRDSWCCTAQYKQFPSEGTSKSARPRRVRRSLNRRYSTARGPTSSAMRAASKISSSRLLAAAAFLSRLLCARPGARWEGGESEWKIQEKGIGEKEANDLIIAHLQDYHHAHWCALCQRQLPTRMNFYCGLLVLQALRFGADAVLPRVVPLGPLPLSGDVCHL